MYCRREDELDIEIEASGYIKQMAGEEQEGNEDKVCIISWAGVFLRCSSIMQEF